ncbi:MAG: tetratricopeptide repeat protein [bacterium]|nr:tetratricopeptide repeat protein [bacterium]
MREASHWEARLDQATRDLEELEQQLATDEIPPSTARRLRRIYTAEIEEARLRLAGEESASSDREPPDQDSRSRFWTPGRVTVTAILGTAAVALVISVGWFVQPEDQTDADGGEFNPAQYSNETMEAVISANADHPQINGMRLALAGRYFRAGDFGRAFAHYRGVLERNPTAAEEAEALSRLGWMAWAGSGEIELAVDTLDRALQAVPDYSQALYFKAIVLWCGAGKAAEAVPLLEEVSGALASEETVAAELAAARAGEECS